MITISKSAPNPNMRLTLPLFLCLAAELLSAHAASVQFFGVTIGRRYSQTSTNSPTILASQGHRAQAFVYSATATTAAVRRPNNSIQPLPIVGNHLELSGTYDTQAAMNSAWQPGNYTLTITNAQDGAKSSTMNLANDFYPLPARVSNFAAAQAIASAQPFTLSWDSLARPVNDPVHVRIQEGATVVFETPIIPGTAGALNGTSLGVTIPADRLAEGRVYTCSILVYRGLVRNTTTIPGALGLTAYTAETILTIRTRFNVQDVRAFGFEKRINYDQTGVSPLLRANGFEMHAFATGSAADSMTSASFRSPAAVVRNLTGAGPDYSFQQAFADQAGMDGAFAGGSYEMRMNTRNNGNRTNALTLTGNYPAPPQVVNIDEAQHVRAGSPFTLSWNLPDGVAGDHVQLTVLDGTTVVLSTPAVIGTSGSLNGSQRSLALPANTLTAGKTYTATLRCSRPVMIDSFTYPTATGVASFARATRFELKTASGASPQPLLSLPVRIGSQTELTFTSVRGERYNVQRSTSLPTWNPAQTVIAPDTVTVLRLPANPNPLEFYRVVIAP